MRVPDVLISGNHQEIKFWRYQQSLERTIERRKDLISEKNLLNFKEQKSYKKKSNNYNKFQNEGVYEDEDHIWM